TDGAERFNVSISANSGLIATGRTGTACTTDRVSACDPIDPQASPMPGGMATAALWRIEHDAFGDVIVGDVLSTTDRNAVEIGPIHVRLANGTLDMVNAPECR